AIFSSNLDEFYRVRVATLRRLSNLNTRSKEILGYNPKKTLDQIQDIVVEQERRFNHLYENEIIKEMEKQKIFILDEKQLNVSRGQFVRDYFRNTLLSTLVPVMIDKKKGFPVLKDRVLYFLVRLTKNKDRSKPRYALIEVPT